MSTKNRSMEAKHQKAKKCAMEDFMEREFHLMAGTMDRAASTIWNMNYRPSYKSRWAKPVAK